MGILKNIFGSQFIDIIQWDNETPGVLVHRFDRQNHEIKWHAKLIVRPGQSAVFVSEGKIADRFGPGTYTLDTKNIPILRNLLSLPYGFESPFKAEVYFIKETEQLGRKWGTANPVLLRDTDFGKVRLRAHGLFSYKIGIRDEMISRFVGSRPEFTAEELETQVKPTIVSSFTDTLGEMHIPALDLAANYDEIGQHMMGKLTPEFANYGLELLAFKLENISLPEEVNKAIDERSTVGALQDASDDYSKIQAAKAMREAANNPGGAGNMMGLLMGAHLGQMAQQPVAYQQPQAAPMPPPPPVAPSFHILLNNAQQGPYTIVQLQQLVGTGQFTGATLVWTAGMAGWQAASTVPTLAGLFQAPPPPPPMAPPPPPVP